MGEVNNENKQAVIFGDVLKFPVGVKEGKVFVLCTQETKLLDMVKSDGQIKRLIALLEFAINDLKAMEDAK